MRRLHYYILTFYYDEEERPRKISVQVHKKTGKKDRWGCEEVDWWGFTIEKKLYCETPHSTKIDFGPYPGVEEKMKQFLDTCDAAMLGFDWGILWHS